ncbi:visual pigment-like receptor peropsin [Periplaneta americana]|uniref:visual pigment-like receptor peropsin n=1 Tax=Periplaneta americana TaxID=6978 RepID=UPI0037E9279D
MTELDSQCPWSPLDGVHRMYVGATLIIAGLVGVAGNSWLASSLLMSPLLSTKAHLIMLNLTLSCLGRGLLAGFPFAGTSTLSGRWLFSEGCCQFFAFLQQFFNVSQVATLTLLAVERMVVNKGLFPGLKLCVRLYVLAILSCWVAAVVWAMPPLLNWGRYGCDPTAMSCSLQWSPGVRGGSMVYNLVFVALGGIVPATVTSVCMWCAVGSMGKAFSPSVHLETDYCSQRAFTKMVGVLVPGLYLMWLPQALLVLWTLTGLPPPTALIVLAPMSSEASAVVPVIACLTCDVKMRRALLGILKKPTTSDTKKGKKKIMLKDIK